jgi:citrate synthase
MTSNPGLEGVVAARTRLSHVDGERGELIIAGYPLAELAPKATFEEVAWLLWNGSRPTSAELREFRRELAGKRSLSRATLALIRECAGARVDSMDALRIAAGSISLEGDDAVTILAQLPSIVAAFWRLVNGNEPVEPRADLAHAANYLYMLAGKEPDAERARALETYLITVIDHGLNASTFTCRVICSTGSDLVSAVVGAIGALKGPLHGGAPGPALETVFEIGDASRAEGVLRQKIESGERLMGFGHRVYKVRDPRADVLGAAAERLFTRAGDMTLYRLARDVERTALRLLEEYKPGRRLQTNVEFYTALLLHGLGLDVPLFTPTFAIGRVGGWLGHAFEQRAANRLIRPASEYVGPTDLHWAPDPARPSPGVPRRAAAGA